MAAKAKTGEEPKRLNRAVGVAEALNRALDPVLKKRGFASRDILTHWAAIAPAPYDQVAMPDKLSWPRGERGADGATLYLRCAPGHALALSHEGERVAAAVNRYFGYVLVGAVRLSAEPFSPGSATAPQSAAEPSPASRERVENALERVADDDVKEALRQLGHAMLSRRDKGR
ncbi:MAG TPA: DciA family protein [Devosiaceae bacterium]|jgi:hypothetical protein|nr:DciA family protein [Devosiaceae bacterium]